MAIPIINNWKSYFAHQDEGLGSSYERIILNGMISEAIAEYDIQTILETPCFGFTGLTGINLMQAVKDGAKVSLEDFDVERISMIRELWATVGLDMQLGYNADFCRLEYADNSFDMSFNFSAMWFVQDLRAFLYELSRVTTKVIFISVPNVTGLGYKGQLKGYSKELYPRLKLAHIDRASIQKILADLGWKIDKRAYFDCPLWPDIGMSKEDFIKNIFPGFSSSHTAPKKPLCIMDFFMGNDPSFPKRMMRYDLLERNAPDSFKAIWAHHYYMRFVPY